MTPATSPPEDPDHVVVQNDPIALAAELLAHTGGPDTAATLIREHTPDRSGRCRGCPHATTLAPRHPCRLRLVGEKLTNLQTGHSR